jgi:hypothetical protein
LAATTAADASAAGGRTDASGFYTVELRHGAYRIEVTAPGYRPYATFVWVRTSHTTWIEATLAPRAAVTPPGTDGAPTARGRIAFSYDGAVWLRNVDGSGGLRLVDGNSRPGRPTAPNSRSCAATPSADTRTSGASAPTAWA